MSEYTGKYSSKQKIAMGVAAVLVVAITTGSIMYLTKPEYVVLYKNIDLKTSGEVTKSLEEMGVQYKLGENGSILIPKSQINKTKMDLAVTGIPKAKFSFDDMLERNNMFMSDEEKEKTYTYALQNHLQDVIEQIPSVDKAFINLSIPKTSEFILQENKQEAKASVFIKIKEGGVVDKKSIEGISLLVANSVEGLKKENVSIHDSAGRLLNPSEENGDGTFDSENHLELQKKVKEDIEKSLNDFLTSMYGYGNYSVMASVKLNFDNDLTESKTFAPPIQDSTDGMVRSIQENQETAGDSQESGTPGVDANGGNPNYAEVSGSGSTFSKSEKTINYELNEIVKKVEKAKGQIEDITVAVVLNREILEGKELTEDKKKEIAKLVSAATGLDTKAVEVYAESFNTDIEKAMSKKEDTKGTLPLWAIIGLIIVSLLPIVLGVGYMFWKKKKAKEKQSEVGVSNELDIAAMEDQIQQIELEIKESGKKKSIEALIEKNPEIVTQLLKSWIEED